ncbi:N-6 DNA methylase [Anaerobacillus sp. HL2]|nr:N-6 DNA methylase [Anaerobacillus sp. HL2]
MMKVKSGKSYEKNNIDAIVGLPPNIFFGTGIPTIILVLKRNRPTSDVLIIDASKGFAKARKNNVLRARDIKIADVVRSRRNPLTSILLLFLRKPFEKNGYNLNIPRYVNSLEPVESWDIHATMFGGVPVSRSTT